MSQRIEALLKKYPQMIQERDCLTHQIAHFKGLSAEEVIQSMYTPCQSGERVQSSALSDKTAQIALTYREKRDRINREWYAHLEKELQSLDEEILFLESALKSLPAKCAPVMWDMVIEGLTWDALAEKHHTCRSNIGKLRKKAVSQLEVLYRQHDEAAIAFMLD